MDQGHVAIAPQRAQSSMKAQWPKPPDLSSLNKPPPAPEVWVPPPPPLRARQSPGFPVDIPGGAPSEQSETTPTPPAPTESAPAASASDANGATGHQSPTAPHSAAPVSHPSPTAPSSLAMALALIGAESIGHATLMEAAAKRGLIQPPKRPKK